MTENPEEALARVRRLIETEGAAAAAEALIAVCRDKAAPMPARATAGTSLLRAAGFFEKREGDGSGKEIHEMTGEELKAHRNKLEANSRALMVLIAEDEDEDGSGAFS